MLCLKSNLNPKKKELLKLLNWNENWKRNKNMNKVKISMKKRAEKKI